MPPNYLLIQKQLDIPHELHAELTTSQHQENYRTIRQWANMQEKWGVYNVTWAAVGTQPTIGNGTLTGRYYRWRNIVHVTINLTWGSTTNGGTQEYTFSLPFIAVPGGEQHITGKYFVNGSVNYWGPAIIGGGQQVVQPYSSFTNANTQIGQIRNTDASGAVGLGVPNVGGAYTWAAAGQNIIINGAYECQ